MAKGYQLNKARLDRVSALGKSLIRRSGSRCELCGVSGEKLSVVEVAPAPETPDPDHALILCSPCREGVEGGRRLDPDRWRFLESVIWSDIPAVQVTAVRLCRELEQKGADWPSGLLETVYLSPETEAWLES